MHLDAQSREALIKVAAQHYADGNLEDTRRVLEGLMQTELRDARPHKLLGCTYFLQEKHAQAIEQYQRAAVLDPNDAYVLVALAELYLITLQFTASTRALHDLRSVDPEGKHPASARAKMLVEKYLKKLGRL